MKIDFAMLHTLEQAGAPAKAIIAYLEEQYRVHDAKRARKRPGDTDRQRRHRADKKRRMHDIGVTRRDQDVTERDTPRAKLFREGTEALMTLGKSDKQARQLLAGWLNQTHDDEAKVLATIFRARDLAVADVAGWVTATLKGANGHGKRSLASAADDLIARAEERERETGFEPADGAFGGAESCKAVGR